MGLTTKLRRGEGPFWGRLKRLVLALLTLHIPAGGLARPLCIAAYGLHVAAREGLAWVLRFFYFEPLFRGQCESIGRGLRMEQLPYLTGRGRLVVGDRVRLSGRPSFTFGNRLHEMPMIVLGEGTFIGHECSIRASDSVRIGRHCLLAGGVIVTDYDGHPLDAKRRRLGEPTPSEQVRPVTIGDDVWIGQRAIILKGVTIGSRSVIGAGAVVVRDIPPDCVAGGNPARVVRNLCGGGDE